MPLGTRDILMAIRAKDEASRIINNISKAFKQCGTDMDDAAQKAQAAGQKSMQVGSALLGVGTGMAIAGAAGIAFYANMSKSAIDYNKQASLTLTQVRETGVGLEDIKDIGKRVGAEIGAPFEQLQAGLYDIFSGTDLTAKQAEKALTSFSKAAVAGAVDIETASKAGISILNGFHYGFDQLDRVMNVQFKTTQLGVLTYKDFASTIGRIIPSATLAGASIEEVGGAVAFMTRNGQSAAMSATALARAYDLLVNPKFVTSMNEFGISIEDANHKIRPMAEVVADLREKLKTMTPLELNAKLKELTLGAGGNIQAMRYWKEAINDSGDSLSSLTSQIGGNADAMDSAYKIMVDTPAAKLQILKNNWAILKTEIGDAVIPIINKAVEVITPLVQKFNDLSPSMKRNIVIAGLVGSALLLLVGVGVAVAGSIMVVSGAAVALGTTLGGLLITLGWVAVAVAAVAAVGYLIYKNWDTIGPFLKKLWADAKKDVETFIAYVKPGLLTLWSNIQSGAQTMWVGLQVIFGYLVGFYNTVLAPAIGTLKVINEQTWNAISGAVDAAWTVLEPIFNALQSFIQTIVIPVLQTLWTIGVAVFNAIAAVAGWLWSNILSPIFNFIATTITTVVVPAIQFIGSVFGVVFNAIMVIVQIAWTILSTVFTMVVNILAVVLRPAVEFIAQVFSIAFNTIATVVKWAWENGIKPTWDAIVAFWNNTLKPIVEAIGTKFKEVWDGLATNMGKAWELVKTNVKNGINELIDILNSGIKNLEKGINIVIDAYNKVPGVSSVANVAFPQIQRLHDGGVVTGQATEVLKILQVGEGVLNRDAMSRMGSEGLDALNSGATLPASRSNSTVVSIQAGAIQINVDGGSGDVRAQVESAVLSALRELSNQVKAS